MSVVFSLIKSCMQLKHHTQTIWAAWHLICLHTSSFISQIRSSRSTKKALQIGRHKRQWEKSEVERVPCDPITTHYRNYHIIYDNIESNFGSKNSTQLTEQQHCGVHLLQFTCAAYALNRFRVKLHLTKWDKFRYLLDKFERKRETCQFPVRHNANDLIIFF